ncbi:hypothetical protein L1987_53451 [Smallanthus sonchifolius]|uniref:Uncharacterized protein n=1 Tax=Smallanthus sonchifolius TaxID=185202 RepID=A0ACB9EW17_9ASTR|nr:hypothetical protein L1987_53451 [Smallanthus sonchifolius]
MGYTRNPTNGITLSTLIRGGEDRRNKGWTKENIKNRQKWNTTKNIGTTKWDIRVLENTKDYMDKIRYPARSTGKLKDKGDNSFLFERYEEWGILGLAAEVEEEVQCLGVDTTID